MSKTLLRDIVIGTKINRLLVKDLFYKNGVKIAKVECDCGNQKEVRVCNLASDRTKSCGCLRSQNLSNLNYDRWEDDPNNDRIGEIHGWLTVIKRDYTAPKRTNIRWICRCRCGRENSITSYQFTRRDGIMSCRTCYPKFMKEGVKMKVRTFYFAEKPIRFVKDETEIWVVADDFSNCIRLNIDIVEKVKRDLGDAHVCMKPVLAKSYMANCLSTKAVLHLINLMPLICGNNLRKWFNKIALPKMATPLPKPKVK